MTETINPETLYITAEQCALRYNISVRKFQMLVKCGDMPQPIKLGCSQRWSIRVLEKFEAEQNNLQSIFSQLASRQFKKSQK